VFSCAAGHQVPRRRQRPRQPRRQPGWMPRSPRRTRLRSAPFPAPAASSEVDRRRGALGRGAQVQGRERGSGTGGKKRGPGGGRGGGITPAGDDEFTNSKIRCHVTASPPALLGARIVRANAADGGLKPPRRAAPKGQQSFISVQHYIQPPATSCSLQCSWHTFFQEGVFLLQLLYASFQFAQPRPVRHVQRQLFPRMRPPVSLYPVSERRLVYPDLPRHFRRPNSAKKLAGWSLTVHGRSNFLFFPVTRSPPVPRPFR